MNCKICGLPIACGDVCHTECVEARDAARGWVSVKDRLPEAGQIVLVCQIYSWLRFEDGVKVTIGRLRPFEDGSRPYWEFQYYRPDFRHKNFLDNDIIGPGSEYVTHWMPLPEPPEEGYDNE